MSQTTGLPGDPSSGLGYASFLLGEVNSGVVSTPQGARYVSQAYGFYIQDHWRATPKFSLSYGLRYDLFLSFHESYDRISYFDPTLANPAAGGLPGAMSFFGNGDGRNGFDSFAKPSSAFSPYVGLAYAVTPSTVIRASYGLSSSPLFGALTSGLSLPGLGAETGWAWTGNSSSLNGGVTPAFNWDNGFPLAPPRLPSLDPSIDNGGTPPAWDRNDIRPARTQNIYFGFEQELPGNIRIKAGYVGTLSHELAVSQELTLNQLNPKYLSLGSLLLQPVNAPAAVAAGILPPYPGFIGPVAQALLPFPQYQGITNILSPSGFSEYNALEVTAQKRYGNGLSLLASYTWSKVLTNVDPGYGAGAGAGILQSMSLLNQLKYLGQFDRPNMFVLSYRYELPFGPGKRFFNAPNPVARQILGGWTVAAIQTYFSGDPIVVTTDQTIPGNFGPVWADSVVGVPVIQTSVGSYNPGPPSNDRYLNPQAFTGPAPFTFGNTRVLNVRNPALLNENVSLIKQFRFTERVAGLLSADVSNFLNRHQWTGLQTDISNPQTFGKFTAATSPRLLQLHAKIEF